MNKTKIVCTIGPASSNYKTIKEMAIAGMDVARFNMSHGTHETHHKGIEVVKQVREELGLPIAIMIDTKGPEIRIGTFADKEVYLEDNSEFILAHDICDGTKDKVYVKHSFSYPLKDSEVEKVSIVAEILKLSNYKNNDKVGEVIVKLDDKEIFRENIYVQVGIKDNKSFFDKVKEFFSSIFG